jgi:ribosomal protein S18 acetylase RimI-like enzyme
MDIDIEFVEGNQDLLDWVSPLWAKLNAYHRRKSVNFVGYYSRLTFPQRKAILLGKAQNGLMRVELVRQKEADQYIAYSITAISAAREGEIESLYVDEAYRGKGIGDELMKRSLTWLDRHAIKVRRATVAAGNEEAADFYRRYGFFLKTMVLEKVNEKQLVQPEAEPEVKHAKRPRKKK